MKKVLFLFILIILSTFPIYGQLKTGELAIVGKNDDQGHSLVNTSDNGFAIAGYTSSFGAGKYDLYVVKLDSGGNLKWTRTIGGTNQDFGFSMIQSLDKGYAVAGYTQSFGLGIANLYVVKLDSSGNLSWTRTVGSTKNEQGYSIVQANDGGFVVAGSATGVTGYDDFYIIKLDSTGNLKWTRTVGGSGEDAAISIAKTYDGGYVTVGYTNSYGVGNNDVYVVKVDSLGNLRWTKTIGGVKDDYGYSIIQTFDKGYAIAGITYSYGSGQSDIYVIKLDSLGNLAWTKTIGGTNYDIAYSIVQTFDKGYTIGGWTSPNQTSNESAYIIKLDSVGNLKWTKIIAGGSSMCYSILQTKDHGFGLSGLAWVSGNLDDVFFMKLDSNGNSCVSEITDSGRVSTGGIIGSGGVAGIDGNVSSGGIIDSGGKQMDICGIYATVEEISTINSVSLYPNPCNGRFTLQLNVAFNKCSIEIFDVLGEQVYIANLNSYTTPIDMSGKPSGVYMYRVITLDGKQVATGKLIIQ